MNKETHYSLDILCEISLNFSFSELNLYFYGFPQLKESLSFWMIYLRARYQVEDPDVCSLIANSLVCNYDQWFSKRETVHDLYVLKDFEFRLRYHNFLIDFIDKIKHVKQRKDLRPYVSMEFMTDISNLGYPLPNNEHDIEAIKCSNLTRYFLIKVGWIMLDPLYNYSVVWQDEKMEVNEITIRKAITDYFIPNNRDWAKAFFESVG